MLPGNYALPVALVLTLGGLLACFAGYRLFRIVLGIYGFVAGAMITTTWLGFSSTWALVMAALIGGVVGAVLMIVAYFVGVGLVGAGLAALVINLAWKAIGGEPPTLVLVVGCVLGALGALSIVRYVVIFGTALAGSWTMILGAIALVTHSSTLSDMVPGALPPASGDVFILYPISQAPTQWWVAPVWLLVGVVGIIVQLITSKKKKLTKRSGWSAGTAR